MKTYKVEITRTSWSTKTFTVEADNSEEAQQKAMDKANNTVFDEDGADYNTESIHEL